MNAPTYARPHRNSAAAFGAPMSRDLVAEARRLLDLAVDFADFKPSREHTEAAKAAAMIAAVEQLKRIGDALDRLAARE